MADDVLVKLPQMGEGVHEATLIQWLKKVGEKVEKDEPLLEIATDKVDTEVVAPASGYLIATFAKEGETIQVQQTLGQISKDAKAKVLQVDSGTSKQIASEKSSSKQPKRSSKAPASGTRTFSAQKTSLQHSTFAGPLRSSPLVRKLAEEYGVSLAEVRGTGLHSRITKEDLYHFLETRQTSSSPSSAEDLSFENSLFRQNTEKKDGKEFLEGVEVERVKMDRIRKLTAEHMLRSVRISPHVTTTFEMDFTNAIAAKKKHEVEFQKKYKSKLSYTAFFIHSTVAALKEHPMLNASVDGDEILMKKQINIACAVATEHGLIVPVLKGMNEKSLFETAISLNEIVKNAREKKLKPSDVQGGTFSITNPGIYGSLHSQPIINQPQVAILSVGAIVERPMVVEGKVAIRSMVQVGVTFDHRIIDGEGGAKFLKSIKNNIEQPLISPF